MPAAAMAPRAGIQLIMAFSPSMAVALWTAPSDVSYPNPANTHRIRALPNAPPNFCDIDEDEKINPVEADELRYAE